MKKIGFCIDSLNTGGAERLLVDLIKLLHSQNEYDIYLLTKEKSNSYLFNEIKNIVNYSFLIENENKRIFLRKLRNSIEKRKNFNLFSSKIDIIIDFLDCDFYKYIKNLKKKKLTWLHLSYNKLKTIKKIEEKLKYYDCICIIADEIEKEIINDNKYFYNLEKIYNFIDYKEIENKKNEDNLLNDKYFLTVCRLNEEQKDVSTLLKAFSKYKGSEKLVIAGDGPDRSTLEKLTTDLKINDRVIFLGMVDNPYPLMKNCEAFILSSKTEGFGLVIVEALYCGAKVISSNCKTGPSEILLNGEIGELFEVGNENELLEKLCLIKNKEYDKQKIETQMKRYSPEEYIKKFKEILEKVY